MCVLQLFVVQSVTSQILKLTSAFLKTVFLHNQQVRTEV